LCAMSRTAGIATLGGRSSRPMTPRRPSDLTLKGGGDRSMLRKRGVTEDVYGTALQRLSDRAKAGLPEPQCPGVERSHSSVARLYADARENHRLTFRRWYALLVGRWLVKPFKGMSAEPTSLSIRSLVTEHGMAYRPRGLGSRSRGSSRGRNDPPGRTGEPCTGQSTTGGQRVRSHAVREMRRAKMALALSMTTGELTEIERLMVSSERGGWKSAHRGNSLAAYSTTCTVLKPSQRGRPR
jgi:hypothetical protein